MLLLLLLFLLLLLLLFLLYVVAACSAPYCSVLLLLYGCCRAYCYTAVAHAVAVALAAATRQYHHRSECFPAIGSLCIAACSPYCICLPGRADWHKQLDDRRLWLYMYHYLPMSARLHLSNSAPPICSLLGMLFCFAATTSHPLLSPVQLTFVLCII